MRTISPHQQIVEENWHQNYEDNPKYICCERIWDCCARVVLEYCIKLKFTSNHNQSLDARLSKCSKGSELILQNDNRAT